MKKFFFLLICRDQSEQYLEDFRSLNLDYLTLVALFGSHVLNSPDCQSIAFFDLVLKNSNKAPLKKEQWCHKVALKKTKTYSSHWTLCQHVCEAENVSSIVKEVHSPAMVV